MRHDASDKMNENIALTVDEGFKVNLKHQREAKILLDKARKEVEDFIKKGQ